MRLTMIVLGLLIVLGVNVASAWEYWSAEEPQPFTSTDSYVIAVGTKDKLEIVKAAKIVEALKGGKEVRLRYVKIEGNIVYHSEIKRSVYFSSATFSGGADFSSATFSGDYAGFSSATFSGGADFGFATFSSGAYFSAATFSDDAFFVSATFFGNASFSSATFSGDYADFGGATFSDDANFSSATFSGDADLRSTFSGDADFSGAYFCYLLFSSATFSGSADFIFATFSDDAYFVAATFSGDADFSSATFSENTKFDKCRFKEGSSFTGCLYPKATKVSFDNVTGFSNMEMEWEYNVEYGEANTKEERKQRGLRGHLKYNETFYTALIKNYQDIGWLKQADDAFYTYRVGKRERLEAYFKITEQSLENLKLEGVPDDELKKLEKIKNQEITGEEEFVDIVEEFVDIIGVNQFQVLKHAKKMRPVNPLYKRVIEYILLDFSFGYGVKPWKLFRTFLILWIPFSFYYIGCLRYKRKEYLLIHSYLLVIIWSLIHSFDTLTPGITLNSLEDPILEKSGHEFPQKSLGVIWVQCIQEFLGWYLLVLFLILCGKIWIR